jgi:hypothetical protein
MFVDFNPLIGSHGSQAHGYRERLSFNGNISHTFASPTVDDTIQPQVAPVTAPSNHNPSDHTRTATPERPHPNDHNPNGLRNAHALDKMVR